MTQDTKPLNERQLSKHLGRIMEEVEELHRASGFPYPAEGVPCVQYHAADPPQQTAALRGLLKAVQSMASDMGIDQ